MKKFIYSLALLLGATATLSSCSDDDDKKGAAVAVPETTFTAANGLQVTYSGEPVLGKTVIFTPSKETNQATLKITSVLNLNDFSGSLPAALQTNVPCFGLIPGEGETTLNVTLTEDKANPGTYTLSGNGASPLCEYKYSGSVSTESLVLNITDARLNITNICGTWNLAPMEYDDMYELVSNPTHVVWQSSAKFDMMGFELEPEGILQILFVMPMIEMNGQDVDLATALTAVLKSVDFREDGNIVANYLNVENPTAGYTFSPMNLAMYAPTSQNTMQVYLNPQAIIAAAAADKTRAEGAIDINNILGNVMAQVVPMFKDGVPMHYDLQGDNLTVYLGSDVLLPLLKENVLPLLKDQNLIDTLVGMIAQNPDMAAMAEMLPSLLQSAGAVIEGTTEMQIGLNFKK